MMKKNFEEDYHAHIEGIGHKYLDLIKNQNIEFYYNEDSEKKNIAEVIIAKHRAGSTGTVELAWLGSYTKFANLAKDY